MRKEKEKRREGEGGNKEREERIEERSKKVKQNIRKVCCYAPPPTHLKRSRTRRGNGGKERGKVSVEREKGNR